MSSPNSIVVSLAGGSQQVVRFRLDQDTGVLRAASIIATPSVLKAACVDSPARYAWERNRLSDLVAFAVDKRDRLVGESWIPLTGLTPEEFSLYVRELARVCDWHEFRLSGQDYY